MASRGCQLDNFLFQRSLNFPNLKFQRVDMDNMRPILLIFTSWHIKFGKLRPLLKSLGSDIVQLTPPSGQYDANGVWDRESGGTLDT